METVAYLSVSSNGLYKYRRRTPKELIDYTNSTEIVKSLGRNHLEAIRKSLEITNVLSEAVGLTQLSSIPKSFIMSLLNDKLKLSKAKPKSQQKKQQTNSWSHLSKLYLEQSNVSELEYATREYFFLNLMPNVFKVLFNTSDLQLDELVYEKQLAVRKLLQKIPNKNIYKYRSMDLLTLLTGIHKGTLDIAPHEYMAVDSINKNLKRMKSLFIFAQNTGAYRGLIPNMTIESKSQPRGQRREFTEQDLALLDEAFSQDKLYPFYMIFKYTGMRLSEIFKCSIVEDNGVLCFSLMDTTQSLKTLSSYRVIPVHHSLHGLLEGLDELKVKYTDKYISKHFSKLIKATLEDSKAKSLYSLRHTFATTLIAKGVQPEVVSELMGHAHSTMTMNRYVKGYPIKVLKEAIDKL